MRDNEEREFYSIPEDEMTDEYYQSLYEESMEVEGALSLEDIENSLITEEELEAIRIEDEKNFKKELKAKKEKKKRDKAKAVLKKENAIKEDYYATIEASHNEHGDYETTNTGRDVVNYTDSYEDPYSNGYQEQSTQGQERGEVDYTNSYEDLYSSNYQEQYNQEQSIQRQEREVVDYTNSYEDPYSKNYHEQSNQNQQREKESIEESIRLAKERRDNYYNNPEVERRNEQDLSRNKEYKENLESYSNTSNTESRHEQEVVSKVRNRYNNYNNPTDNNNYDSYVNNQHKNQNNNTESTTYRESEMGDSVEKRGVYSAISQSRNSNNGFNREFSIDNLANRRDETRKVESSQTFERKVDTQSSKPERFNTSSELRSEVRRQSHIHNQYGELVEIVNPNKVRNTTEHKREVEKKLMEEPSSFKLNGRSSDFKRTNPSDKDNLGETVITKRKELAAREQTIADFEVRVRKEHNFRKEVATKEILGAVNESTKGIAKNISGAVSGGVSSAVNEDKAVNTATQTARYTQEYGGLILSSRHIIAAGRIPPDSYTLNKVLSEKRFSAISSMDSLKRSETINLLETARGKRFTEITELKNSLKSNALMNPKKLEEIKKAIARKENAVDKYSKKIKDLKLLNKIKGKDGDRAAILIRKSDVSIRRLKRTPINLFRKIIQKSSDETIRQFNSALRFVPAIKKSALAVSFLVKGVGKGVFVAGKFIGNKALATTAGRALAQTKLAKGVSSFTKGAQSTVKTASNVGGGILRVAKHPVKYAGRGVARGSKYLGKQALRKINTLSDTNRIKRATNLVRLANKKAGLLAKKAVSKFNNSLIGRAINKIMKGFNKFKSMLSIVLQAFSAILGFFSTLFSVIIIILIVMMLISSVMMIEEPERNLAHLADELYKQQQEFQNEVLEMTNLADDKTNVVIHLPSDTLSLDNRREILSMTAVYFGQDFSPPKNGSLWNAGDRWIGDGINDDVIRYMEALLKASHQKKVVNEIRLEMRDTLLGAYDKDIHPNGGRPLPETMVWKYLEGTTYTYDFYVRTDEEKVPYWSPWFQITPITEYPEDYSEYKTRSITKPNGEVWIERELEYTLPVDVFETQGFDIPEALEHNKTDGVVFKFNGEIYEAIESRETEINYMHIFVDVKRFDPIFDLDGAGNLYYNDRIGVAADKLFNYNLKDYSYINTSGLIAVGKYSWSGNEALGLIKEIWENLGETEKSSLQSSYPTEFSKLTNTISSGAQWYSLRIDSQTDEFKSLIKEILVSLPGVEAQQKRHAEKVGKVFNYLKGKGILDEKVLLFFGEMTFRKGEAAMNSGVYNTMITSYLNSDKTLDTAKSLYDSIVRSSEDNSVNSRVDNNYKTISEMEGLRDNLSSAGQWMYPAENWYRVTSPFGVRGPVRDPNGNVVSGGMHYGIDLAIPMNTPLVAAHDGVITGASFSSCGGNILEVKATDSITYRYNHLSSFAASVGQEVKAGQVIAFSGGAAGQGDRCTSGPHLHFEVREGGNTRANAINPETLIDFRSGESGTVVSGPVVIGKLYNRNPEWEGWTEENREWAKNIYSQDWADLYGLYDHGAIGVESNPNFTGFINPAIGVDNVIDESKIEDYMKRLPADMSTKQKNLVRNLLNGISVVKYVNNGLPTGPGLTGAQGGLGHPGLIEWAYLNIGSSVKGQFSTHEKLWYASRPTTKDEVQIGDISFQYNGESGVGGNISIYVGNGYWISMTNNSLEINPYTTNTNFRSLTNFR